MNNFLGGEVKRFYVLILIAGIVGLSACSGLNNERQKILYDYGVSAENGFSKDELQTAMSLMLPDSGSVLSLENKFSYIFEEHSHILQMLNDEFSRLYQIEDNPTLKMEEAKRLISTNAENDLAEFWLDQLALEGNPEAHYMLHGLAGLHSDLSPRNLIFAAQQGFIDAQVDLGDWYLRRNRSDDAQHAYFWFLKAQEQGRDIPHRLAKIPQILSAHLMRKVEGRIK